MDSNQLKDLLVRISRKEITVEEGLALLRDLPYQDLGFACIDHHRHLRRGVSEVIFAEGKESDEILAIMEKMVESGDRILITRISEEKAKRVQDKFPDCSYHKRSRTLTLLRQPLPKASATGTLVVMCAGTSDIPVAEEAAITARFMGTEVETVYDVGVSGIHRIFGHKDKIRKASVLVVVAGMEGALPSIIAGLVDKPVIAVPTSVGYGANFQGIAALLGMLNSCAAGVTVVNIDNGFGAGYAASIMIRSRDTL